MVENGGVETGAGADLGADAVENTAENPDLRFGFVRGTAPSKWLERWRASDYTARIMSEPVAADLFYADICTELLAAGGVLLVRAGAGVKPAQHSIGALHTVKLYDEAQALLLATDHELAEQAEISDPSDFELIKLLDHPA
ncbi:MAG: hypothetical protein Q4C71_05470, partial [Microbacteriaceae bacterium]|nr:hypothetical protein [Microbacteriaceae bacterium]